ncbi:hypothetical protein [Marinomonas algicola]|uniref:hypothetical protein n=1 Tax=Marinomonas algicola TaxID=2773454 RepID=UPI00174BF741|nr:hypothetical protein [Marinomonas algicola]
MNHDCIYANPIAAMHDDYVYRRGNALNGRNDTLLHCIDKVDFSLSIIAIKQTTPAFAGVIYLTN